MAFSVRHRIDHARVWGHRVSSPTVTRAVSRAPRRFRRAVADGGVAARSAIARRAVAVVASLFILPSPLDEAAAGRQHERAGNNC